MLRTPICDLFGIEYPILLAGMGGVVDGAARRRGVERGRPRRHGRRGRSSPDDSADGDPEDAELTQKPFAVDLLAPIPEMIVPYLPVLFEEEVKIFVAGLACPRSTSPR
jgi:enoyl-[acyl-carrier protein] reductase II